MSKGSRPRISDWKIYGDNYEEIFRSLHGDRKTEEALEEMRQEKACSDCNFLREKQKFSWTVRFCRHKGQHDSGLKGCILWEAREPGYSAMAMIDDYK